MFQQFAVRSNAWMAEVAKKSELLLALLSVRELGPHM